MTVSLTTVMACTKIATVVCLLLVQGLAALSAAPGVSYGGQPVTPSRHELNTATTTTKTATAQCEVTNTDEFLYNKIRNLLEWKTKLINYNVSFVNYSTNPLLENTTRNYKVRRVLSTESYTCSMASLLARSTSSQVRFMRSVISMVSLSRPFQGNLLVAWKETPSSSCFYQHHRCAAVVSRGWAKASECCL